MVATFVIEILLAIYTIWQYKLNTIAKLIAGILVFLALFQIAEFNVCESKTTGGTVWARVGYVAITILPVLAVHLVKAVSGRGSRIMVWLAYLSCAVFASFFGFSHAAFLSQVCGGNYVIFHLSYAVSSYYYGYYFFWLTFGVIEALYFTIDAVHDVREVLMLQVIGILTFLIPTGLVNLFSPKSNLGIPSIMCGFAIIYAFILVFGIVPLILQKKHRNVAKA
jgi:hypothetical protein